MLWDHALSMEKEKSSKLWKVSYRVLWIGNYEWQIVPGGWKFLRCARAKRPVKNQSSFTWSSSWLICSINRVCCTDSQGAGGAKCFLNPPAFKFSVYLLCIFFCLSHLFHGPSYLQFLPIFAMIFVQFAYRVKLHKLLFQLMAILRSRQLMNT